MKIALYTLGCKLNQAESEELKETLQKEGFFIVDWKNKANVYIVNACGLTTGAEQGTRQIIRQAHRQNPKAKIFVTGCFEQNMPEVNFYTKNQNELIKKIKNAASTPEYGACSASDARQAPQSGDSAKQALPSINRPSKTRAFIKIQTGCDNFCSYCIIPYFRGKPKSVNALKIISTINRKVTQGFKEIVLSGINICKYKFTETDKRKLTTRINADHKSDLVLLTMEILRRTAIPRIRFGSLDPSLINDNFFSLFHNPRVMPHMHLSLQSGSNHILKLMNRKYTIQKYLSLVEKIKKQFPLMGFTTDIIVGFPGETEKDFRETCRLVKKVGFLKVHIFPYSPRPGTTATKMAKQIDEKIKKERFARLKKIAEKVKKNFIKKMIGQTVPVLFEKKVNDTWFGYTPNYLMVRFQSNENLKNKIKNITINQKNIT